MNRKIYVTRPFLPPLEELHPYLEQIWENKWLTNQGPMHQELESALTSYLKVPNVTLTSNGTLGLICALQALQISGEVITTPYSFIATAHSLHWNRIKPIFVDIDPDTFNIDPARIEAAITPETTAILAVHVYGNPCDVEEIQRIADKHGLKVVYDAAHAFDVEYKGRSLLEYGDMSVLSFHATKVFNTFEGGAIICRDPAHKSTIERLKNFGYESETSIIDPGINAKMNEVQAAFGLLQLKHMARARAGRERVDTYYRQTLGNVRGLKLFNGDKNARPNYSYFPVLIGPESKVTRDQLFDILTQAGVHTRKYFYPLISTFSPYSELPSATSRNLPEASRIASEVLCLPLYADLSESDQSFIVEAILSAT